MLTDDELKDKFVELAVAQLKTKKIESKQNWVSKSAEVYKQQRLPQFETAFRFNKTNNKTNYSPVNVKG